MISVSDLRHILKSLGEQLTDQQVESLLREADQDGNGALDYNGTSWEGFSRLHESRQGRGCGGFT